nr:MAG: DNA pilot protein [Microvirus sp.]
MPGEEIASGTPWGAIANAGGQLVGGVVDAFAGAARNKKERQFAIEMYNRQRADALSDWNRNNEYNSPSAQMQRFKAAGLNPNLMYGQGSSGEASPVRSSSVPSYRPEKTNFLSGVAGGAAGYLDARAQVLQIDNLKKQGDILESEKALKDSQTVRNLVSSDTGRFDLGLKSELRSTSLEFQKQSLRNLQQKFDLSFNEDARRTLLTNQSLQNSVENLVNVRLQRDNIRANTASIRERIKLMGLDEEMKKYENALAAKGVFRGDPLWLRAILTTFGDSVNKLVDSFRLPLVGGFKQAGSNLRKNFFSNSRDTFELNGKKYVKGFNSIWPVK